ncbi:MAG: hypothetical protein HFH41_03675 [Lachnospiraceae bacterium]|nr:hypothetical protein [Lachnospiraceae bacterium]
MEQYKTGKWTEEELRQGLQKAAEAEEIPEKLQPEQMEFWLRQKTRKNGKDQQRTRGNGRDHMKEKRDEKKRSYRRWWCGTAVTAAAAALVLFAAGHSIDWKQGMKLEESVKEEKKQDLAAEGENPADPESEKTEGVTYQELYQAFSDIWKEQEEIEIASQDRGVMFETKESEEDTKDMAVEESGSQSSTSSKEASKSYGKTNQQEKNVEEADIVKNDGRYLYQVVYRDRDHKYAVQIIDTGEELENAAMAGEFDNEISEIYVWKDKLVVIETGWINETEEEEIQEEEGSIFEMIKGFAEDVFAARKVAAQETAYSRIHVYDIKDRRNPREYHTFTIKGNYRDSRISDGYLYFFSGCNTYRPRLEKNYKAYVPEMDGEPLSPDRIYLPENPDAASYLVMASINMAKPDEFTDTAAIVTAADRFYVSERSIYVADSQHFEYGKTGIQNDSTRIYRFSYQDGKMKKEAEGTVKGLLRDDMAMNEQNGYLRLVTTVEQQKVEEIVDDITGEVIGTDSVEFETSNSLYVLDKKLKVAGKIENLAREEQIYAARFMGDIGYFVTFRQTDPLFSVDLSDPKHPRILGELKISGFSEYLHFYDKDLLLGIGKEADENTGATEGLKLSMFDTSDPSDVKETAKLNLPEYEYAEALYDYKAVFIDTDKNLFGFYAEGYGEEYLCRYLLFTFQEGKFQEVMNIDCSDQRKYSYRVRGTYIDDRFYLLCENGKVEEYSLTDGGKLRELLP